MIQPVVDKLTTITHEQVKPLLDAAPHSVDYQAGITIVKLEDIAIMNLPVLGNAAGLQYSFYAARVFPQGSNQNYINPHVHYHGEEAYHFLAGTNGEMSLGKIADGEVKSWTKKEISPGDTVLIKAREVHTIRNNGAEPIDFVFACPPSHLIDKSEDKPEGDRVFTKGLEGGVPPWYPPTIG